MTLPREQIDPAVCPPDEAGDQAVGRAQRRDPRGRIPAGPPQIDETEIEAWVEQARGGDRDAFQRLILHFQDRVWRRAYYRLRDREEAFDVAQEVFLLCFRKLHQFRGEARFWTWLCRIVDNQVKNRLGWLKRRAHDLTYSLDAPPPGADEAATGWDPPDPAPSPRQQVQGREALTALDRCLHLLSADHREVLLLRFADGLSYEEIAETMQVSLGTVKSRINRARAELRALMTDHLE